MAKAGVGQPEAVEPEPIAADEVPAEAVEPEEDDDAALDESEDFD